jgi:hypothetical protein
VAGTKPRTDTDRRVVSVAVRQSTPMLLAAGRRLEDIHIAPADLGIRRPSFDDVFLALTDGTRNGDHQAWRAADTDAEASR